MPDDPAPPNPPFYTEEELDALYERDPVEAMRISCEQAALMQGRCTDRRPECAAAH
jgi:hypothetical protein